MKQRALRIVSIFMTINLLFQIAFPTIAFALTGGPSQPEVQSFEPVGTTEMVDVSSGDFVYNIPLLDVDGYPINLSYHSGITMDQEASWVGLGWNINPGVINRNMRGVPDDFNGDQITKDMYLKPNYTFGLDVGATWELFGTKTKWKKVEGSLNLSASLGIFYNNYKGIGLQESITPSISAGHNLKITGSYAISSNTQSGLTLSPSLKMSLSSTVSNATKQEDNTGGISVSIGSSYNSRSGTKSLTYSKGLDFSKQVNYTAKVIKTDKDGFQTTTSEKRIGSKKECNVSSGGSSISFAGQSYVPQINMSMTNMNISARFTMGTEVFGFNAAAFISGYFSDQWVKNEQLTKNSYGYLYSQESRGNNDVLHDINREKDGAYSKNSPTLPITMYAYDMYAVSGQGIGGMYRPYRSDIGHLHDDEMKCSGGGGSAGGEVGVGNLVKWGADINGNYSSSQSSSWSNAEGNDLANIFDWSKKGDSWVNEKYEPAYFKNVGEKTPIEKGFIAFKNIGSAIRPAFKTSAGGLGGTTRDLEPETESDKLIAGDGTEPPPNTFTNDPRIIAIDLSQDHLARWARDKRNQGIQYLTWAEQTLFLENKNNPIPLPNQTYRKPDHIGEITAVNASGSRYVYGIAAYNTTQEEVSFTNKDCINCSSTSSTQKNAEAAMRRNTGLANYYLDYYKTKKGELTNGYDGYYNGTTLPAYAHSYLLTAVLSPDYVDVKRDGVTQDDLGTYTKINYDCKNLQYRWRTPYDKAMHNEGLKSEAHDDKGSFTCGEKEIWMVSSIESKNYIAEFTLNEDRHDAYSVQTIHDANGFDTKEGGWGTTAQKSYSLRSIALYSKINGVKSSTPIKIVHFEYDYSLCKGVDNNSANHTVNGFVKNEGKLTLKRVYFTYGNSNKGVLNSYQFTYPSFSENPYYDIKGYDRWGNFKPNTYNAAKASNAEFPYTDQQNADAYSQAWSLIKIKLPSGGTIDIDYESDDYAYVQNKRAMQMVTGATATKIIGFGSDPNSANGSSNELYTHTESRDFIYLHLAQPCTSEAEFEKKYMPEQIKPWDPTTYLYFNFLVDITKGNYEYIRGYAEIDKNLRCHRIDDYTYAIKLKGVHTGDSNSSHDANQIAKAAWQFARINLASLVYPGSDMYNEKSDVEDVLRGLVGVFVDMVDMFEGINDKLRSKYFAQKVDLDKSWVRLKNPDGKKKGGGVRVKSIRLNDNWGAMVSGGTSVNYGQEYDYTTIEDGATISSGVATYEPMIGNDENPFRQPVLYNKENSLIPDELFYSEEPMGETFFPSPAITYSKVTVRNLSAPGVTKHATGKVVHEFYTTRDFPTIVNRTDLQTVAEVPDWISGIFSIKVKNHVTVSQGYQIELNDMNGKQKAQWVYAEPTGSLTEGRRISGIQYFYKTDPNNGSHLNNSATVINNDNSVNNDVTVGVESDMVLDSRENESYTVSGGLQLNMTLFTVGIIPVIVPVVLPSFSSDETRFRSAVITRVIQRYGLMEKTVAYQDNSIITTQNLALDAETGEVLLTKTQNEFNDDVYNLTHPAHWAYDGMGMAYRNVGVEIGITVNTSNLPVNDGVIALSNGGNVFDYFKPGDEVAINGGIYWVHQIEGTSNLRLIDELGVYKYGNNMSAKIIRSGARNMQNTPIMQTTTLNKSPVNSQTNPNTILLSGAAKVLNSKADEFSEIWKTNCLTVNREPCTYTVSIEEMQDLLKYFVNGNMLDVPSVHNSSEDIIQNYVSDFSYPNSTTKGLLQGCNQPHAFKVVNSSASRDVMVDYIDYEITQAYITNETLCTDMELTHEQIMQLIYSHLNIDPATITGVSGPVAASDGNGKYTYTISFNNNEPVAITIDALGNVTTTLNNDLFNLYDLLSPCPEGYVRKIVIPYNPGSDGPLSYKCCSTYVVEHPAETTEVIRQHAVPHRFRTLGYDIITCGGVHICANFTYDEDICGLDRTISSIEIVNGSVNIIFNGTPACSTTGTLNVCPCQSFTNCAIVPNTVVNPYLAGLKGNWRPVKSYLYLANRDYSKHNIRIDGIYLAYTPFWSVTGANFSPNGASDLNWVWTSQTVNYLPQGFEVENKDKLGRYNAALFSNSRLPVSVANNAQYREIFVDNFEQINNDEHSYGLSSGSNISSKVSHTGLQSLVLAKNLSFEKEFCLAGCNTNSNLCEDNCIMPFAPYPGKKYVFTGWIKTDVPLGNVADKDATITISFKGANGVILIPVSFSSSGPIIDGWQRFEKNIPIPVTAQKMTVKVIASSLYNFTWFDDLRIFPFNGNMKSYVYNPINLKLMAELDENNYAGFYEYDEQGALKRIKRETERGVMTIKETRNHMKSN